MEKSNDPKILVNELLEMQISALIHNDFSTWIAEKETYLLLSVEGIRNKLKEFEIQARKRLEPVQNYLKGD